MQMQTQHSKMNGPVSCPAWAIVGPAFKKLPVEDLITVFNMTAEKDGTPKIEDVDFWRPGDKQEELRRQLVLVLDKLLVYVARTKDGKLELRPQPEEKKEEPVSDSNGEVAADEKATTTKKTVAKRGGKAIGQSAAKKKALTETQDAVNATKASKAKAKAKATKAKSNDGEKKPKFGDDQALKVLKKENPRREGTKLFKIFELYQKHDTVGGFRKEAIAAGLVEDGYGYLRNDVRAGNIKIS